MIATFEHVAKWYGRVIGLVDVTVEIGPGVTGLLGPNGAGKSTFLKLLTGQLTPSQGAVRLLGKDPFRAPSVHACVGFVPEQDAFYDDMTGRAFIRYLTRLHGHGAAEAGRRTEVALERVGLSDVAGRRIRTYSKGMRQRIKLAQAIAHEPEVLILDEPLTGMDPVARRRTMDLLREFAGRGATVIVSSHVLHEVEAMTSQVVLLHQGRVLARGGKEEIRRELSRYPHQILLRSAEPRALARELLQLPGVIGVHLAKSEVRVETRYPDELYDRLPQVVLEQRLPVEALEAEDAGLDAIFEYLVS
ncbi:MAG: ABC transporter ATP-binding protein [Planctomycetota bacterium]